MTSTASEMSDSQASCSSGYSDLPPLEDIEPNNLEISIDCMPTVANPPVVPPVSNTQHMVLPPLVTPQPAINPLRMVPPQPVAHSSWLFGQSYQEPPNKISPLTAEINLFSDVFPNIISGINNIDNENIYRVFGKIPTESGNIDHNVEIHLVNNHVYDNFLAKATSNDITYVTVSMNQCCKIIKDPTHFIHHVNFTKLVFYPTCCSYFGYKSIVTPEHIEIANFAHKVATNGGTVIAADYASTLGLVILHKYIMETPISLQIGYNGIGVLSFHREILGKINTSFKFLALANDTNMLMVKLMTSTILPMFHKNMDYTQYPYLTIGGLYTQLPQYTPATHKIKISYEGVGEVNFSLNPLIRVCQLDDGRWAAEGSQFYEHFKAIENSIDGYPAIIKFNVGSGFLIVCGLHLVNFTNPSMTDPDRIYTAAQECGMYEFLNTIEKMKAEGVPSGLYAVASEQALFTATNSSG